MSLGLGELIIRGSLVVAPHAEIPSLVFKCVHKEETSGQTNQLADEMPW